MCPTRKVRKGLACGWERDPHIRPDYTRLEGPHQAAVVLTVRGGLPTSKLLQKKVAVGLHVLEDRRCVTRLQSACHDKPHALEAWIVPLSATPPLLAIAATGI